MDLVLGNVNAEDRVGEKRLGSGRVCRKHDKHSQFALFRPYKWRTIGRPRGESKVTVGPNLCSKVPMLHGVEPE